MLYRLILILLLTVTLLNLVFAQPNTNVSSDADWRPLFNGENLDGWMVPEGDGGHWKVTDGVIDYDAQSEAEKDKNLWSEEEFGDFELRLEWRLKETPYTNPNVMVIRPDGTPQRNADGEIVRLAMPDSDSGVYVRGTSKAQINIWSWPVGSGEIWGYRTDPEMPDEVRSGATPNTFADNHIGEWNRFEIRVEGNLITVTLNGKTVIKDTELPGLSDTGPIALQHHGSTDENGEWNSPPSLVQFRNIEIREL